MKNIVRIISFISLAFVFGLANVNAQSLRSTFDAEIPFDFAIGDTPFAAGTYRLRISGEQNGIKILEIRNPQHDVLYRSLMVENGERDRSPELRFENTTGKLALAKIVTPNAGFTISETKKRRSVEVSRKAGQTSITN